MAQRHGFDVDAFSYFDVMPQEVAQPASFRSQNNPAVYTPEGVMNPELFFNTEAGKAEADKNFFDYLQGLSGGVVDFAKNNIPDIIGRAALMQAGMGAGAMTGLGLPGVLMGLFAGAKAPFRNTPSMQAFNQLTPAQRQSVSSIYGQGGIMQGYNPISAFGKGPAGAIQDRIDNIIERKYAGKTYSKDNLARLQTALTNVGGEDSTGGGDYSQAPGRDSAAAQEASNRDAARGRF